MFAVAPGGGGGKGPGSCKPSRAGDKGVAGVQWLVAGPGDTTGSGLPAGGDKSCGGGNRLGAVLVGRRVLSPEAVPAGTGVWRAAEAGLAGAIPLLKLESVPLGNEVVDAGVAAWPGGSVGVPGKPIAGGDVAETLRSATPGRQSPQSDMRQPVVTNTNIPPRQAAMPSHRGGFP